MRRLRGRPQASAATADLLSSASSVLSLMWASGS
jgi:hypothetical protein